MESLCEPDDFADYKKRTQGKTRLVASRISIDKFMDTLTLGKTFDIDAGLERQPAV